MALQRWISTERNRRKIAMKLFRHETIHMNNFGTIIENKAVVYIIKNKVITWNVKLNWD